MLVPDSEHGINLSQLQLPELSPITNAVILEIADFKNRNSRKCTQQLFYKWVVQIYGSNWPRPDSPSCSAVVRSVSRLVAKRQNIQKMRFGSGKEEVMSEFLDQEFVLPTIGFHHNKIVHFTPVKKQSSQKSMTTNASPPPLMTLLPPQTVSAKAPPDTKELKQKMYAQNRNAQKRLKRREALIQKQSELIETQKQKITRYEMQLLGSEREVKKLKMKLDRVNHRAGYWKGRISDLDHKCKSDKKKLQKEIKDLKVSISTLDLENAEMHDKIQSIIASDPEITTFENGKYTEDIRACVYELLSLNVGVKNVRPIIQCVLKNIAHKSVKRLPSYGLTCQMIIESLAIAQAQLGDELSDTNGFTTLQSDGTTKFGVHFTTFDVRLPDSRTYSLGLRHVFSGSSADTLEILNQILSDIDSVSSVQGKEKASSKILLKIKNTMSDRHSAEKLFNDLLSDFRKEILPCVVENWDDLEDIEQDQLVQMNNFFCGLHFLVGLATSADETVSLWEAQNSATLDKSVSSHTQQLIRTACKALHHQGSQQCGSAVLFKSFLKKNGISKVPLAKFVGNRFNILFYDAAGTYYLHQHMINFLVSVHGMKSNRLFQAVLRDLRNPLLIAGCRALGLVDKIVSGPLWKKLEESTSSILKMSSVYTEMKLKFDLWTADSSDVINGSSFCFLEVPVSNDDPVWNSLIQSNSTDDDTRDLLQHIFHSFSITTQRLLIDHLPGGIYYGKADDTDMAHETKSVPTTNTSPERDFAVLDRLLREKPNANIIALEAMLLFAHNKTSLWLNNLSRNEKEKLIEAARTLAPSFLKKYKNRRREIETRQTELLEKRVQENAQKEATLLKEKQRLTKEIEAVGFWISRSDVDSGLEKCGNKKKALKIQIQFRDKVLCQKHPNKNIFKFSHKRKQLSLSEMKENLLLLIHASSESHSSNYQPLNLPQNSDKSCGNNSDDSEDEFVSLEDKVRQCPEVLIGTRIKHRFEEDNELVWYTGTVLSMNENNKDYMVQYDNDDEVYSYALLDDISNGDLITIPP